MRKCRAGTLVPTDKLQTGWQTPPEIIERTEVYFGGRIPFDAATTKANPTKATLFATPEENGLHVDWPRQVWLNPPYGAELKRWMAKLDAQRLGREVVTLLPVNRFETRYMQQLLGPHCARCGAHLERHDGGWECPATGPSTFALEPRPLVCFITGRVRFINPATGDAVPGNPFGNYLLGLGCDPERFQLAYGGIGLCLSLNSLAQPITLEAARRPDPRAWMGASP